MKKADLVNDDAQNLQYTREIRDLWQKHYRDVLAKDLETNPSTLEGQKWLNEMFGYRTNLDDEVDRLEKKVKKQEKKNKKAEESYDLGAPSFKGNNKYNVKVKDYTGNKMSSNKAINQAYADLEKQIPNFNNLPIDVQDNLWMAYVNDSGLCNWI